VEGGFLGRKSGGREIFRQKKWWTGDFWAEKMVEGGYLGRKDGGRWIFR